MDTNPGLFDFIKVVSQLFNISEVQAAFYIGGITISGILLLVGQLVFKFEVWNKARGAAHVPMQAFTTKTPHQVVKESQAASMKITLALVAILSLIVCGGLYLLAGQPGEAQMIIQPILNQLRSFFSR